MLFGTLCFSIQHASNRTIQLHVCWQTCHFLLLPLLAWGYFEYWRCVSALPLSCQTHSIKTSFKAVWPLHKHWFYPSPHNWGLILCFTNHSVFKAMYCWGFLVCFSGQKTFSASVHYIQEHLDKYCVVLAVVLSTVSRVISSHLIHHFGP